MRILSVKTRHPQVLHSGSSVFVTVPSEGRRFEQNTQSRESGKMGKKLHEGKIKGNRGMKILNASLFNFKGLFSASRSNTKIILQTRGVRASTGFDWLMTGYNRGHLKQKKHAFRTRHSITLPAKQLLSSLKAAGSIDFVNYR
jgi:hypothetical protein